MELAGCKRLGAEPRARVGVGLMTGLWGTGDLSISYEFLMINMRIVYTVAYFRLFETSSLFDFGWVACTLRLVSDIHLLRDERAM